MRHAFEFAKAQKAAGPFDRVDRAKDAAERGRRAGVLLEHHEIAIQLIEVFITLDQKIFDDIVVHTVQPHLRAISAQLSVMNRRHSHLWRTRTWEVGGEAAGTRGI